MSDSEEELEQLSEEEQGSEWEEYEPVSDDDNVVVLPRSARASQAYPLRQNSMFNPRQLAQEHERLLAVPRAGVCPFTQEALQGYSENELFQHIVCGNSMDRQEMTRWLATAENNICPNCNNDEACDLVLI